MVWEQGKELNNGKFIIVGEEPLGSGGFGITYKVARTRDRQLFVIKTLNAIAQNRSNFRQLKDDFFNEAQTLAGFKHDHIVKIYPKGFTEQEDELWCMVMEFIEGQNLEEYLQTNKEISEIDAIALITKVGKALAYIHQSSYVHRDIKPSNIMLRNSDLSSPVLIDFGLAREFDPNQSLTMDSRLTEHFAPLEQYDLDSLPSYINVDKSIYKVGTWTDVYSLAATLYNLLTIKEPMEARFRHVSPKDFKSPQQLNPKISDHTNAAILKGMSLNPQDRSQTISEWLDLLSGNVLNNGLYRLQEPLNQNHMSTNACDFYDKYNIAHEASETKSQTPIVIKTSSNNKFSSVGTQISEPSKRRQNKNYQNHTYRTRRNIITSIILASGGLISFTFASFLFGGNNEDKGVKSDGKPKQPEISKTPADTEKEIEGQPTASEDKASNKIDQNKLDFKIVNVNRYGIIIREENRSANYYVEDLGDNISLNMISLPGGKFQMGWPKATEVEKSIRKYDPDFYNLKFPSHEVTVPSFYIGQYLITQTEYKAITGTNPSRYRENEDRPVESIYWDDAVKFCQKLSEKTGKIYNLPSEAQWEYACRAGTRTPFYFGETLTSQLANYRATEIYANEPKGSYREITMPVGSFPPNNFGLYDMHGNVWEWCEDNWHDSYDNAPKDGSAWLSGDDNFKVIRGGSLNNAPGDCRSFYRTYERKSSHDNSNIGFRVVCLNSNNI